MYNFHIRPHEICKVSICVYALVLTLALSPSPSPSPTLADAEVLYEGVTYNFVGNLVNVYRHMHMHVHVHTDLVLIVTHVCIL